MKEMQPPKMSTVKPPKTAKADKENVGACQNLSACEGFFGRLKNEMFYRRDWAYVSIEDFMASLDTYIRRYNMVQIKDYLS